MMQIHLYLGNHNSVRHAVDAAMFFVASMNDLGYSVTVGHNFRRESLNFVLEFFTPSIILKIRDFNQLTGKKICIIQTEFFSKTNGIVYLNGLPIDEADQCMPVSVRQLRYKSLCAAVADAVAVVTLGDMPDMSRLAAAIGPHRQFRLRYPRIPAVDMDIVKGFKPKYDFVFSGSPTVFRNQLVSIYGKKYTFAKFPGLARSGGRGDRILQGRWVFDLPQHPKWQYLSIGRVLHALSIGRPTVTIKKGTGCPIEKFCLMTNAADIMSDNFSSTLDAYVEHYVRYIDEYSQFAISQPREQCFDDFISEWARRESIASD